MDTVETFTVDSRTVRIHRDTDSDDPRGEWDHHAVLVLNHGRTSLPCEHTIDFDAHGSWEEVAAAVAAEVDVAALLTVYGYDHEQLTIRAGEPYSDRWDSGTAGVAYVTRAAMNECFPTGWTPELAEQLIRDEVTEYDQWLTGDVYGYVVTDSDGTELDSCWGMYGLDYCRESAATAAKDAPDAPPSATVTLTLTREQRDALVERVQVLLDYEGGESNTDAVVFWSSVITALGSSPVSV